MGLKRVGLLGCGSIGTEIALAIDNKNISAILTHVYDQSIEQSTKLVSKLTRKPIIVNNVELLAKSKIDIIVETASQNAVKDNAVMILENKKDLMILSVGALLDELLFDDIVKSCKNFKQKVFLPSGAIVGLDGIKSLRNELESIILITKKNPKSLKGAKFFEINDVHIDNLKKPLVLFEGDAREATRLFPANINVSALLSIAGLGAINTTVKIIADPNIKKNIHIIKANGKFGNLYIKIENVTTHNNPRTSKLAILSAVECLSSICSGTIIVGT